MKFTKLSCTILLTPVLFTCYTNAMFFNNSVLRIVKQSVCWVSNSTNKHCFPISTYAIKKNSFSTNKQKFLELAENEKKTLKNKRAVQNLLEELEFVYKNMMERKERIRTRDLVTNMEPQFEQMDIHRAREILLEAAQQNMSDPEIERKFNQIIEKTGDCDVVNSYRNRKLQGKTIVNISHINKALLLKKLFAYARPNPETIAFLEYNPRDKLEDYEVKRILNSGRSDYEKGRPMKIYLTDNEIDVEGYNMSNGAGAAEQIIAEFKK